MRSSSNIDETLQSTAATANGTVKRDHMIMWKQAFEEMLYRPPFLVFLAVSLFESVDLIWSARTTVRSNPPAT